MANFINSKLLAKLSIDYTPPEQNYIADEILTTIPVVDVAGKYAIFAKHPSKQSDDTIGVKSETSKLDTGRLKTEGTFACEDHGHKDLVTDKEASVYGDFANLAEEAAYALKKQLLLNKEITVAALVTASIYNIGPAPKWDGTNPTIEKDIRAGIAAFESQSGVSPNTIIIPKEVWDKIVMDPTLRDIWKLVPSVSKDIKLSSVLALLFDNFKKVLIPNAKKDTALKGLTETLTPIWTDKVTLLYTVPRGTTRTFTWAAKFQKNDLKTKQWVNEDPEGTWIKLFYEDDKKVICPTACYNLLDVLT